MWSKIAGIFSFLIPLVVFAATREGQELIGTPAPAFNLDHWVNSSRLELSDLKGKVLLVRWWTDTCELCAATAPALRELQDEYGTRGFQVIGIFHPKPAGDWNLERMKRAAAHYQFTFPVADDGDWKTLRRWWLNGTDREYTSVSFIVDKHGIIRYVHPGGEYHESNGASAHETCNTDFKKIQAVIAELLAKN